MKFSHVMSSSFLKIQNISLDSVLMFSLYGLFFLLPWYPATSGQLQPVDVFIFSSAVLLFIRQKTFGQMFFYSVKQSGAFFILLVYMALRCGLAAFGHHEGFYLFLANSYYFVLFVVFLSAFFYLYESRSLQAFYETLLNCLLLAPLLPILTLILYGSDYGLAALQANEPTIVRPILTFNNPNQMGFFAFVNLAVFFYLSLFVEDQGVKIKKIISLLIINMNLVLLLLSVSRGAAPAIILYLFSYFFIFEFQMRKKNPRLFWALISFISVAWFSGVYVYHHFLLVKTGVQSAVHVSFLEDLYGRAVAGYQYNFGRLSWMLFGNGELSNPLRLHGLEFHNNFFAIFNQVGLVGLLIYGYVVFGFLLRLFQKGFLYIFPLMCYLVYSQLHYAFRTRMNWLFFAIIVFLFAVQIRKQYSGMFKAGDFVG